MERRPRGTRESMRQAGGAIAGASVDQSREYLVDTPFALSTG